MAVLLSSLPAGKQPSAGVSVIALAATVALLYYGRVFCITVVISLIIAVLLEPLVVLGIRLRLPRPAASLLACVVALVVVYLIGLGAYTQISSLRDDLPAYSARINELVDAGAGQLDAVEKYLVETFVPKRFREPEATPASPQPMIRRKRTRLVVQPTVPPPIQEVRIHPEPKSIFTYLYNYIASIYNVLLMASFVPFLVYFMLSWRDHFRRSVLSLFDPADRHAAGKTWQAITQASRAYVVGNFLLGLILSLASCIFFFWIGLPYWLIVGLLSGFLSLVPYAGLPLALIPPLFAGLAVFTRIPMFLAIAAVVAILHLLALNLLYPRLVGGRLHLNPLAVTLSLMFWGTIWGGIGLVLAIPVTAAIKAICDNVSGLQGFGRLLGD
jgi:predicted PurR-regulated permease PerM